MTSEEANELIAMMNEHFKKTNASIEELTVFLGIILAHTSMMDGYKQECFDSVFQKVRLKLVKECGSK